MPDQPAIQITRAEAAIVRDLLKLCDEIWENPKCKYGCLCPVCQAVSVAGEHLSSDFNSLEKKVAG